MNEYEIDPFSAERILDAAATGDVVEGFEDLGEVLGAFHEPADESELAGDLPPVAITPLVVPSGARRLARRTAVAASVAVLALGGAAALATGAPLLEPILGPADPVVVDNGVVAEALDAPTAVDPTGSSLAAADDSTSSAGGDEVPAVAAPPAEEAATGAAVDPSAGLSDEELVILCEEAANHGEYVSQVARDREGDGSHGESVSGAAHSECGHTDEVTDVVDDTPGVV
ncbi:MAG: hypothetical protein ACE5GB_00720, partial [Acidimicrobiales bacterium]